MIGVVGDGVFKLLLGAGFVGWAGWFAGALGVPDALMVVAGLALLAAGGAELAFVRRRLRRTYLRLMVAYDCGWVLTALAGLVVAWAGGEFGGEVWVGYQVAAPLAFAALLAAAEPVGEGVTAPSS